MFLSKFLESKKKENEMKKFYVWFTDCAIVESESIENIDRGDFEFIRMTNEDSSIRLKIIENIDCIEEVEP